MLRIRAMYQFEYGGIGLNIYKNRMDGKVYKVGPIEMVEVTEEYTRPTPCLVFENMEMLQELFNDLWSIGLRPSEGTEEYKSELMAITNHLNDMRSLVFKDKRQDIVRR